MKKLSITFGILLLNAQLFAQATTEPAAVASQGFSLTSSELLIFFMLLFALVVLFASVMLLKALKVIVNQQMHPTQYVKYQAPPLLDYPQWQKENKGKPNIWTKLLSLKPLEEEDGLLIPHTYDGISELNNPVPRWFNILFYGSVIFAAGYLYYYHFADGPRQDQEYATEMAKADADKRAFLAKSGEKYDESTIKVDLSMVADGQVVYAANCIACHGEHGEGIVGPNLTDEFWLHGGSINDVFKTVKYGVPEKGMISWEKTLSAKKIAEVTNYIMSIQGSKPANPKAPQGPKYEAVAAK